ncbi:MAG: LUD domain-containing protein [Hyphomicrobiaceae bacterium]|nr:LUD domain-containing protein [Hyphomicrobiaceae bacterium]
MTARDAILGRVRSSLGVKAGDQRRAAIAAERMAQHPETLVPDRAKQAGPALFAQFRALLEGQQAMVIEAGPAEAVPQAIARYLESIGETTGKPPAIRFGSDARLAAMPWRDVDWIDVRHGAAEPGDRVGLSHALAGISETGTLVIAAGRDNPVTLAFMPETHIIAVARETIVGSYEQALDLVRGAFGGSGMPRTLNYISGPSRTADIGGKIVIGAHGPRRLCVIVIG